MARWRKLRDNVFAVVLLALLSTGIWYLVDQELSDRQELAVPLAVVYETADQRQRWTITERPDTITVIFEGTKEAMALLNQKRNTLRALVRILDKELQDAASQPEYIHHIRSTDELAFEFAEGPIPAEVTAEVPELLASELKIVLARNRELELDIRDRQVLAAIVDPPADYEVGIHDVDPRKVYAVVPSTEGFAGELAFVPLALKVGGTIFSRGEPYRRKLELDRGPRGLIQYYADRARSEPIGRVEVSFVFRSKRPIVRVLKDVPVRVMLPARLANDGVRVDRAPLLKSKVVIQGPPELRAFKELASAAFLVLVIDESGVDLEALGRDGHVLVNNARYELLFDPDVQTPPGLDLKRLTLVPTAPRDPAVPPQPFALTASLTLHKSRTP